MAKKPHQLIITVEQDGVVKNDFLNFTGSACIDKGRQLHALLAEFGIETEGATITPKPELSGASVEQVVSQQVEMLQEGER